MLAYGLQRRTRSRLDHAIRTQYRAQMGAAKWFAVMFPLADLFGAMSPGHRHGGRRHPRTRRGGSNLGEMIAFIFLVNLLLLPIAELSEILDQTQTAIAGWRKILGVLATPIDVVEPDRRDAPCRRGALAVDLDGVRFAYRTGDEVLRGIDLHLPAGAAVAVVGETGSGKTTIAKLLCRLADPTAGAVRVGGVDLREVDARVARRAAVRMVPAGRLPVRHHARRERPRRPRPTPPTRRCAPRSRPSGWAAWLDDLPGGLEAEVGERGTNLSVGERQLVALARAQLGDPGLLILDEATSSVDPETEQALTEALERLSAGPHRREHRPPPVDRRAGRPGDRGGRRRGRRAGHATPSWWRPAASTPGSTRAGSATRGSSTTTADGLGGWGHVRHRPGRRRPPAHHHQAGAPAPGPHPARAARAAARLHRHREPRPDGRQPGAQPLAGDRRPGAQGGARQALPGRRTAVPRRQRVRPRPPAASSG